MIKQENSASITLSQSGPPAELQINNVDAGYGEFIAIRNVSISINKAEIVSVIGPNGAGKTTLLKTIIGLLKPKKGDIYFEGKKISGASPRQMAKSGIGYVPQGPTSFHR